MTNKSISLIMSLKYKENDEKEEILKAVTQIEFKRIKAQAKVVMKDKTENIILLKKIIECNDSNELFGYLKELSVIDISLLSSYGVEVDYMNIIKVSD